MGKLKEFVAISAAELRRRGSEIVNSVAYGGDHVVITRHGRPVAAIVSLLVLDALSDIEDRIDRADARRARVDARKHGTISIAEVKARLRKK